MPTEIERAVEFFERARLAEERNEFNTAEIDYLKSANLFQQIGEMYFLDAACVLTALAVLREGRGNHHGALCSAKHAEKILEEQEAETSSPRADQIRLQTWGLIGNLYRQMDRCAEAEKMVRQALEYARRKFGEEDRATGSTLDSLKIPVIQGLE